MRWTTASAALILGALGASCCARPAPIPAFPADLPDAAVLEQLRIRQSQVATLTAEGRGSLRGTTGGDGTFLWQCWAQGTSRMRLVLRHRIKGLLADAVIEGDRASCYDPEAGTLEKGPLSAIRAPGLSQTASLLRLLAGPADALAFEGPGAKDRLVLDIGGGRRWRLKLERAHLVYASGELRRQGGATGEEILARVDFRPEGYRLLGAIPWPMEMTVDQPGEPWKLQLRFSETQLGVPIPPETFKLQVPEGTRIVEAPQP